MYRVRILQAASYIKFNAGIDRVASAISCTPQAVMNKIHTKRRQSYVSFSIVIDTGDPLAECGLENHPWHHVMLFNVVGGALGGGLRDRAGGCLSELRAWRCSDDLFRKIPSYASTRGIMLIETLGADQVTAERAVKGQVVRTRATLGHIARPILSNWPSAAAIPLQED